MVHAVFCSFFTEITRTFFFFRAEKVLKDRHEDDAHEPRGKSAVIQQKSAMQRRNLPNEEIMHKGCNHRVKKAVFPGNRRHAVGKAQTDNDRLMIDCQLIVLKKQAQRHGYNNVTQRKRKNISNVRARTARGQHREHATEGDGVKLRTDKIVDDQDKQAVCTDVHQESGISVRTDKIRLISVGAKQLHKRSKTAHKKPEDHEKREQDSAKMSALRIDAVCSLTGVGGTSILGMA